nr:ATP-binding protein [Planctomycetota bacterium]
EAREISSVVARALDMELSLMLMAYRRSERVASRQKDRMVYAQRAARRLAQTLYDRVDAALCYAELADTSEPERREYLAKLKDVLRGLARHDQRMQVQAKVNGMAPGRVRLAEVCRAALADVSVDANTRLSLSVEPPGLEAEIVGQAVRLAVEELAQNAMRHAPGGVIHVRVHQGEEKGVIVEVTDQGPGWDATIREFKDIYALGSGLGLSFCELVAELHQGSIELFNATSGGAGVRLVLREVVALGA